MKEITIKLTDREYYQYVKKGQSEYYIRMKKAIKDEAHVKPNNFFLLSLHHFGSSVSTLSPLLVSNCYKENRPPRYHG